MPNDFNPISALREALENTNACSLHPPLHVSRSITEAELWNEVIAKCSQTQRTAHLRWLAQNDLYYLIRFILHNKWMTHEWFFSRCAEVQAEPDNCLDFWSRTAGKSLIITFGKSIQDILVNPEITIGIFSHTRPIAKQFLRQIKTEFQINDELKELFPEILWKNPEKQAPKWSEDDGIIVQRSGNPKECTVEAYGLTDGQPTSKHYQLLVYDDVIEEKSVTGPDMIDKVTKAWELSLNLSAVDPIRFRVAGTFYDSADTYHTMMERGFGKARIRPIVVTGQSLLLSEAGLAQKKQSMSARTFALQILLDPSAAAREFGFKAEWIEGNRCRYVTAPNLNTLNKYLLVDPAGTGPESESFTAMWVVGLNFDHRYFILDAIRDRLNLTERGDGVFSLMRKYQVENKGILKVAYERHSMQADVEYLKERMDRENFRFELVPVGTNKLSKEQRIEMLMPLFEHEKMLLPKTIPYVNKKGMQVDLVKQFIDLEYLPFPYNSKYQDMLDALSRIVDPDLNVAWPRAYGSTEAGIEHWRLENNGGGSGWMSE